ncbi:hypothetical protein B0H14DRAFT_2902909 [Mycena olivaceomarginata]|nr:hypothetical protein B0H14DRAFT_2902909 [Mycena olivaceomarginata]
MRLLLDAALASGEGVAIRGNIVEPSEEHLRLDEAEGTRAREEDKGAAVAWAWTRRGSDVKAGRRARGVDAAAGRNGAGVEAQERKAWQRCGGGTGRARGVDAAARRDRAGVVAHGMGGGDTGGTGWQGSTGKGGCGVARGVLEVGARGIGSGQE